MIDVLVIEAGLAGLQCARVLSRAGCSVAVVDGCSYASRSGSATACTCAATTATPPPSRAPSSRAAAPPR